MQTIPRPSTKGGGPIPSLRRRRRFSPMMFIGTGVTLVVILAASIFLVVIPYIKSHAAAVNMDCTLIIPPDPLSAKGLSTPFQLVATTPANGACNEANANQAAFVQGAVIDPATGQISVYNPLVIDQGTQPAAAPIVPQLPQNGIVGLWFGFNGANLTLQDSNGSLQQGKCVNGVNASIFGQFAYCNAPAFFREARNAMKAGKLVPPALGMSNDGKPCLTVRDFGVVDQDQSDNVTTTYLTTANGQTAQMTMANTAALQNAQPEVNGSDNRLLAIALDGALGCTPWTAPDLADPGHTVPALPLNELQAAANQAAPVALVPANDPMTLNNANVDVNKLNAYRVGVNQPRVANANAASTTTYCQNLMDTGAPRIALDAPLTVKRPSPDPAVGNSLFTFLAQRFMNTFGAGNLNCVQLVGKPSPIQTTLDGNGVAISATLNGQPINTQAAGTGTGTGTGAAPTPTPVATTGTGTGTGTTPPVAVAPNCNVNGAAVAGCAGSVTLNGQTCKFTFMNNTVTLTCPNQGTTGGTGAGTGGATGGTTTGGATGGTTTGGATGGTTPQVVLPLNNVGSSDDNQPLDGNFDGWGNSYSLQAMQAAGLTAGKSIPFNGVNFTWPTAAAAAADNVRAQGQVIPVTAVQNATTLAFLGSSSNGPTMGTATITYSDGTTQSFLIGLSDWTLNGGVSQPSFGNQIVTVMPYRNTANGMMAHQPHIFYADVVLQAGKTIKSVTLPAKVNQGQMHIFAIATK